MTLADVAALAGVSKATASRAMNQPQLVAPETRRRVEEAATTLGFSVNRAARALAKGSTGLVSIVVPTLENTFFTPIIQGAQRAAEAGDLHATVAVLPGETEAERERLVRLADQVDGFVLASPRSSGTFLRTLSERKPLVTVDRQVDGLPSVIADTPKALSGLVSGLIDAGHTRIAYVGGPEGSWMDARRVHAIEAAAGDSCDVVVLGPVPPVFRSGVALARELVATRATAVIVYASAIALGLLFALEREGVAVPGDLTIASADDLAVGLLEGLGVTALHVDADRVGETAMATLLTMLSTGSAPAPLHQRVAVPLHWGSP
ncbi:LacI family DNA-binding transcriptional regulator [Sinomonas sp. JGH33]|uniref:LacI family DNA-binding transcriptional regulator n=1 Tax=Sinomonas terricola TaxID=3110330 RepID=A0ABU5T731_9MICC|nr:LacI family DNA-binding transcriptional regulator [Sinomonas sp. JGH33]MEA5455467.1 LacI family DNA-binding transcriptional regulator [Sinomonas sp. JGH33]